MLALVQQQETTLTLLGGRMNEPLTIPLREASAKCGLSRARLVGLIKNGQIRGAKPGKEVLVYWDSLKSFLARHEIRTESESA